MRQGAEAITPRTSGARVSSFPGLSLCFCKKNNMKLMSSDAPQGCLTLSPQLQTGFDVCCLVSTTVAFWGLASVAVFVFCLTSDLVDPCQVEAEEEDDRPASTSHPCHPSTSLEKPPDLNPFFDDLALLSQRKSSENTLERVFFELFC